MFLGDAESDFTPPDVQVAPPDNGGFNYDAFMKSIDGGSPVPQAQPTQSTTSQWDGILSKAIDTWGKIETLNVQKDIVKSQAQTQARAYNPYQTTSAYRYNTGNLNLPGLSPVFSPVPQQDNTMLYLGAAMLVGIGLYLARN